MEHHNYDLQILIKLGLTPNQGKLYLTLLKIGRASGRTLSNETELARQEIYRLTSELHERGLVEKIIGSPLEFQAVTIKDCISILMMRKRIEFQKTKAFAQNLINNYSTQKVVPAKKQYNFLMIPPKQKIKETRERMLNNAKESVHLITTARRFIQGIENFFGNYKAAFQRNISFQIIVQEQKEKSIIMKKAQPLLNYPNVHLRFTCKSAANLLIIDKNEAIVTLQPKGDLGTSSVLWTDHPEFLTIYQDYFKTLWKASEKSE